MPRRPSCSRHASQRPGAAEAPSPASLALGTLSRIATGLSGESKPKRSPSPPFRGEREGPRRDSAGEGEVGSVADCFVSNREHA
jgi:hypothetical protein